MCVKSAALTTHSPPKTFARPRTATPPSRALPLAHAAPTHARRLRDARPPTAQPIPRRRPPLAPAQRHALAEHFRSPTQPRRTPTDCAMHSPPKTFARPAQRHALAEHFRPPRSPTHARRLCDAFPAEDLRSPRAFSHALPEHFRSPTQPRHTPTQPRRTPAGCATHSPQPSQLTPRRRSAPAPAQRHALPEHFLTPFPRTSAPPPRRRTPAGCAMHSPPKTFARPLCSASDTKKRHRTVDVRCIPRRPHDPFPAEDLRPPPHSDTPSQTLLLAHAAQMHARRPHDPSPAEDLRPPPHSAVVRPRSASLPPPPFRFGHKKNGTAQWMCDAECLGRPSLPSVIGVGEPRAVRRRCGALAWRVGLRPQPWALRSRRCGRVLRA